MTTETKSVNYSTVQVDNLVSAYTMEGLSDADRKEVMEKFAKDFGKTVNSIRSKLSREKVYVKPAKISKSGSVIARKADLVEDLALMMQVDVSKIQSFEKGTKIALETVIGYIASIENELQS